MAERQSNNIKTGEDDLTNASTRSDFLSVSGDITTNSEFLYVCGRGSSAIRTEDGITSTSKGSDFLSVSGGMTLKNEFPYVRERGSSIIRGDSTRSKYSAEAEGSSFPYIDASRESVKSRFTPSPEDGHAYVNMQLLKPEDTIPLNDEPNCFNCVADEKHIQATHFCRSCKSNGIYICYKCLQSHNRWHHDHIVDTLSVFDTSLSIKATEDVKETETHEDSEREKISHDTVQQARAASSGSNVTIPHGANASLFEHKTANATEQEERSLGETTYSGFNDKKRERFAAESKVKKHFFQDKLYAGCIKDMQYMKQEKRSTLQKYGTYSVKSQSDTKCSIITSICTLESGHLVIADSENCMIKILKEDNYKLISSHKVEGHPTLLSLTEKGKLAIQFANNVIRIVLIEKEIQVTNSFEIKPGLLRITGLTYGKGNLYVCVSQRIDVYSETGEKTDSFRPLLSSNTDQKFVHFNKITMNKNKDTLYIADKNSGIIVSDTSGNIKQIIAQYIAEPDAICTAGSGFLFVTEVSSDRVLKISANDGSVIQELKEVSKNAHPVSLCHDSITNRLIVGVWSSNNIHVYSCT